MTRLERFINNSGYSTINVGTSFDTYLMQIANELTTISQRMEKGTNIKDVIKKMLRDGEIPEKLKLELLAGVGEWTVI